MGGIAGGCGEAEARRARHGRHSRGLRRGRGEDGTLQCSYLENPRDRGAWWAAVYPMSQLFA